LALSEVDWSHQVNDLSLLVSGHCPPSMIRSGALKCTTGELFPSMVTILLALCNLPKAVMAVTEVTSKPLSSLGSSPPRLREGSLYVIYICLNRY
jgi:hypothetical protein